MIELIKEFGMAILWLFLGYLVGGKKYGWSNLSGNSSLC